MYENDEESDVRVRDGATRDDWSRIANATDTLIGEADAVFRATGDQRIGALRETAMRIRLLARRFGLTRG